MLLTITNSDLFVNQRVYVNSLSDVEQQRVNGLLCRIWDPKSVRARRHASVSPLGHIQGSVYDYRVLDQDLWSDDFVFNRFGHA
jgi:hypothetical protein